jgi:hypothetical protein
MRDASTDSSFILQPSSLPIPLPRIPITVRPATPADIPFIDSLQKRHSRMVGFMPRGQLEGKIACGHVLIAEDVTGYSLLGARCGSAPDTSNQYPLTSNSLGYVIATDRYFKHDDVGIIYQLNVVPGNQRKFVGATLLKAVFDRAAYGCRLFCCWCAQDIEANRFWEAMGFVPLAYRAGSDKKGRVHIFWQKRIREGDTGEKATPWWFPSQTTGGAIREDRLVLPIPPGTHWSDAKAVILPGAGDMEHTESTEIRERKRITGARKTSPLASLPTKAPAITRSSGLRFDAAKEPFVEKAPAKKPRERKPKAKNDPRLVAAARELRDRWLEHVNGGGEELLPTGKYDLTRALPAPKARPLLLPRNAA